VILLDALIFYFGIMQYRYPSKGLIKAFGKYLDGILDDIWLLWTPLQRTCEKPWQEKRYNMIWHDNNKIRTTVRRKIQTKENDKDACGDMHA